MPNVPYDATAVRPQWHELPEAVRARVAERVGAVAEVEVAGGGFTRGFAALVRTTSGAAVFVKATSTTSLPVIASSYRAEIAVLQALPDGVPAPRLLWHDDDVDGWVLFGIEPVIGHMPGLPWSSTDLASAVTACEAAAEALTPAPPDLQLERLVADISADSPEWTYFAQVADGKLHGEALTPWARGQLAELQRLVSLAPTALDGETGCHGDLRPDNLIVDADGRTWVCDWNWLSLAAAWTDLVGLLITAHADGHDADAVFARSWLAREADPEAVDSWLAVIATFMLIHADDPPEPFASPWLGAHRKYFGQAAMSWLEQRRTA
jgi:hypothetical protein